MPEVLRRQAFPGVGALLFVAATVLAMVGSLSMQGMGEVPMPGGWALSTAWMPMCGQSWAGAAAAFIGMWVPMMVAMMLPALLPMLQRHRPPPDTACDARPQARPVLAAAGYFFVWTVLGMLIFMLGAALAQALLQMNAAARTVPALAGLVVLLAGALQFTAWKARHLACCRQPPMRLPNHAITAWRHGVRLGLHCVCSCAGLTAMLLVMGVMDLRAMALVTAAITAERLAPAGERVARAVGAIAVAAGLLLTARAVWPA